MSSNSKWKKIIGKKWTFPAIYMTVAALILTLMWWYQDGHNTSLTQEDLGIQTTTNASDLAKDEQAVPVAAQQEQMVWPVQNPDKVDIKMEYFDLSQSEKEMEKAIVRFQNDIWPHTGIDIVSKDKTVLTVVAALSGEVVRAEKDPVVGYMVDIKHENGLVTNYSSLSELKVAKGDQVNQGQILGLAGRNIFEKEQGVHLHFEVRKGDVALSPEAFIGQDANQVLKQLEAKQTVQNEEPKTEQPKSEDPKTDQKQPEQTPEQKTDSNTEQPKTNNTQKAPTSLLNDLN
ncbi:M23 family metallopeptidase [Tepidibacillus marianensis]|uniref:M23 family metallopeptidase n=1 Tax=Tepidibacillus marianensis TaxID=3131995 RepID=UPI0030D0F04A